MPDTPNEGSPSPTPLRADRKLRRLAWIVLASLGVLLLVAAGTMGSMYFAATAGVEWYERALAIEPARADAARRELESLLSAAYSESQAYPEWSLRVSAEEINGWLTVRLPKEHPGFAEAGLTEPRVRIEGDTITLAARTDAGRIEGVLTAVLRPGVSDAGELVLDLVETKLGRLAIPPAAVVAQARQTPLEERAPVRWSVTSGRTAAIVAPQRIDTPSGLVLRIVGIDLRDGEMLLRGASDGPTYNDADDPTAEGQSTATQIGDGA